MAASLCHSLVHVLFILEAKTGLYSQPVQHLTSQHFHLLQQQNMIVIITGNHVAANAVFANAFENAAVNPTASNAE